MLTLISVSHNRCSAIILRPHRVEEDTYNSCYDKGRLNSKVDTLLETNQVLVWPIVSQNLCESVRPTDVHEVSPSATVRIDTKPATAMPLQRKTCIPPSATELDGPVHATAMCTLTPPKQAYNLRL